MITIKTLHHSTAEKKENMESPDDMDVIDASIPEIDSALESIPDGERRDLIWEYWFTPISEEVTVYEGDVDFTETNQEKQTRKLDELRKLDKLLSMPIDELYLQVEQVRIQNDLLENSVPQIVYSNNENLSVLNRAMSINKYQKTFLNQKKSGATVLYELACTVYWNVENGKIIHLRIFLSLQIFRTQIFWIV